MNLKTDSWTCVSTLPAHTADEGTIENALDNLIGNALKFGKPETPPRIRVWADEGVGTVRLWVEDNGIGIDPRYQERIFWVFERLHDRDVYEGTGIGLAMVKKGVERMGGRVGVESEPGVGSRFWIELLRP